MVSKIRVAIIDDSVFFREFLSRSLAGQPGIEIVGVFGDPVEAMSRIVQLRPDVMTVDMEMPKMRGNEFLRKALPKCPTTKAVVISSLSGNVFDAMHAGAIDFVGKPGSQPGYEKEQFVVDIVRKIKIAAAAHARVPLQTRPPVQTRSSAPVRVQTAFPGRTANLLGVTPKSIIAIGASTGGTEAIIEVIKDFPANTPAVIIVQHMPPVFTKMYAERVDKICAMSVREAKHADRLERGTILIAPGGDQQLRVVSDSRGYYVTLATEPKVNGHCPSVDVMFESVAKIAGGSAVGVILTGMGADGARNLLAMKRAGAYTFGQDEESCVVYGMPKVAYDLGGVSEQLPLNAIGDAVLRKFSK